MSPIGVCQAILRMCLIMLALTAILAPDGDKYRADVALFLTSGRPWWMFVLVCFGVLLACAQDFDRKDRT